MTDIKFLVKRNIKMFFKDKGLFFTSLITPFILLVLYSTFLSNVYKSSFVENMPKGFKVADSLINGLVGGQLIGSLLAVSCITVAFCSNMLMVQDKFNGARDDFRITPVKSSHLALGYFLATLTCTFIICLFAMVAGLIYIACIGWYITATDILMLILTLFIMVIFGTSLSSVINFFLSSQGQISAVGSLVSSVYGFICGAYMPISTFSDGLQKVISFLPGTYGTSLIKQNALRGVFEEMSKTHFPSKEIEMIKDSIDYNLYFFDNKVSTLSMYMIIAGFSIAMLLLYILMNKFSKKTK